MDIRRLVSSTYLVALGGGTHGKKPRQPIVREKSLCSTYLSRINQQGRLELHGQIGVRFQYAMWRASGAQLASGLNIPPPPQCPFPGCEKQNQVGTSQHPHPQRKFLILLILTKLMDRTCFLRCPCTNLKQSTLAAITLSILGVKRSSLESRNLSPIPFRSIS